MREEDDPTQTQGPSLSAARRVIEDALDLLDKGSGTEENILPRPSVQGPLRDAVNSFVRRDSHDVATSVVVMQGISGCGKTTPVEGSTTVLEELPALPSDRAPDVCTITAALQHETSPYFVWRWFLCWALSESRDSEPATGGECWAGVVIAQSLQRQVVKNSTSRKVCNAQGRSLRSNRSGLGGGGSGEAVLAATTAAVIVARMASIVDPEDPTLQGARASPLAVPPAPRSPRRS